MNWRATFEVPTFVGEVVDRRGVLAELRDGSRARFVERAAPWVPDPIDAVPLRAASAHLARATLAAMSAAMLPGVYRLTFRDWLKFPDDGRLYEVIDGELYMTPPPSIAHQRISRDLEFLLVRYVRDNDAGEVLDAPVGVKLADDDIVEPDIVVVTKPNAAKIGEQVIDGAPDLVIEILSPGTARRDLVIKREKYLAAGVREYWIVDPASRAVEVLALEQGAYVRHGLFAREDVLTSRVLAKLTIALREVFSA